MTDLPQRVSLKLYAEDIYIDEVEHFRKGRRK